MKAQLEFQTSGMFTETLQYLDRGGDTRNARNRRWSIRKYWRLGLKVIGSNFSTAGQVPYQMALY